MTKKGGNSIDILILSDNGLETVGGEQESTKIIINGVKDEFKLGVIQPGKVKMKSSSVKYYNMTEKMRIKHLIKNLFAFISYINKIRKIIKRDKPKIIHTQAQVSFFIIGLLSKLKLIPKSTKFIHTERGLYIWYSFFFKKLFKFFMTELDTLITTTKFNMKHWKKALISIKFNQINFMVIENTAGEIFETFDPSKKKKHNKFVVSFAGRYSAQKNWPLAVEIAEKLYEEIGSSLKVIMAVGCLDKKSELVTKEMFKNLKNKLGDSFKGSINIDLEQMNELYYETDIFIVTSLPNSESFGRTVVEAMSRKCIVLSTDAGGPTEIIGRRDNILKNSDEFVSRILELYNDKDLFEMESDLGYEKFKNSYSLNNNLEQHSELYRN